MLIIFSQRESNNLTLPVVHSHTVIDVRTVVVKLYNTSIAYPAVFGT